MEGAMLVSTSAGFGCSAATCASGGCDLFASPGEDLVAMALQPANAEIKSMSSVMRLAFLIIDKLLASQGKLKQLSALPIVLGVVFTDSTGDFTVDAGIIPGSNFLIYSINKLYIIDRFFTIAMFHPDFPSRQAIMEPID